MIKNDLIHQPLSLLSNLKNDSRNLYTFRLFIINALIAAFEAALKGIHYSSVRYFKNRNRILSWTWGG